MGWWIGRCAQVHGGPWAARTKGTVAPHQRAGPGSSPAVAGDEKDDAVEPVRGSL
jgi:hypothetical protein